ncbi:hypothetical protein SDC9_101130 [bioreactor metagenome]|uniref:NAD-dependent epimerase/dehydratase domain-containing protein n=1 Tax=bioreactor metagenome TaxID=1076179 RepID=A0A645AM68_9ZZZZ|nr:NAD-dependent epimerase/dehydratase family protein [Christensenella sp.]
MPNAVVLGATGHIGSYLVPALVDAGYDVLAVSRGNRAPYTGDLPEWKGVRQVFTSREEAIRSVIDRNTELVCDLLPYTRQDAEDLVSRFKSLKTAQNVRLISIGSIWIYDKKLEAPVSESHPRTAMDDYGRGKAEIEQYLLEEHERCGLRVTILHPGHICGRGWMPVGPQGNRDPQVIREIMAGKPILLPERGQATLHHVHSEDIARLTVTCLENENSVGESFHSVCKTALTLSGMGEQLYQHFGFEPLIEYKPYHEFLNELTKENATVSAEHIDRSPVASMEKANRLLGFEPKHSSIDTVIEAIESIKNEL